MPRPPLAVLSSPALIVAVLVGACYGGSRPTAGPTDAATTSMAPQTPTATARRTQSVPSRGPIPTARSFEPLPYEPMPCPSWFSPCPVMPTFPPLPSPTPSPRPDIALIELVPSEIDGHAVEVVSGWASDIGESGDMCWVFCPGELQDTARAVGADPAAVSFAVGFVEVAGGGVYIRAFRIPNGQGDLVAAWLASSPFSLYSEVTRITVAGHAVSLIEAAFDSTPPTYTVVLDDIVFAVNVEPVSADRANPGGLVEEVIAGLP